jgi:hypothetical protein
MKHYPEDQSELNYFEELEAPQWMLEPLKLNPNYTGWGPGDDGMKGPGEWWDNAFVVDGWDANRLTVDELNEIVNFYFKINRPAKNCEPCHQTGYNPATRAIAESFYDFQTDDGNSGWKAHITEDELGILKAKDRIPRAATLEQVNNANGAGGSARFDMYLGHDAINRLILVRERAERLGVWGYCEACNGNGSTYTGPATLDLVLLVLHPRKGASRGWTIKNIQHAELPEVYKFLRTAAESNAKRFAKIPAIEAMAVQG